MRGVGGGSSCGEHMHKRGMEVNERERVVGEVEHQRREARERGEMPSAFRLFAQALALSRARSLAHRVQPHLPLPLAVPRVEGQRAHHTAPPLAQDAQALGRLPLREDHLGTDAQKRGRDFVGLPRSMRGDRILM
eukprot:488482-Prymnesium_polylepis.1